MADLDQSSSDVSSGDFKAKGSSEDSKLGFSEDEETLITIMYNLVGKRLADSDFLLPLVQSSFSLSSRHCRS